MWGEPVRGLGCLWGEYQEGVYRERMLAGGSIVEGFAKVDT